MPDDPVVAKRELILPSYAHVANTGVRDSVRGAYIFTGNDDRERRSERREPNFQCRLASGQKNGND